ncbi:MAG: TIGR00730 family Rossman fold protein [Acidobacteriota bacterium]|jgi:uncharacterized protein (TIGR00730 family)|nr:TIGR00730 family Rossman fold protein [Acidobacteriota bacterium]
MGRTPKPPVKSYNNTEFLNGPDARLIRILSEYLEPAARFEAERIEDTIVFFGSARILPLAESTRWLEETRQGQDADEAAVTRAERAVRLSRYYEDAVELARLVTEWSMGLGGEKKRMVVCSGGGPGIMEAANRGAQEAGGQSIGLSISLPMEQATNAHVPGELAFEFHYFFMRKFWFVHLAKAVVIFPGGFGTLDEAFEVMTLVQTGKTGRPVPILFYGEEYWRDILHIDALARWGMISPGDVKLLHFCNEPQQAFETLKRELARTGNIF